MKPFANIPGVIYPPDSSPESTIDRSTREPVVRRTSPRVVRVAGRNLSVNWLERNGLCVRRVNGVRTVVVDSLETS